MEEGTPPRRKRDDDLMGEARERVRLMRAHVEQNKSLLARTRAVIQRLSDLLLGNSKP